MRWATLALLCLILIQAVLSTSLENLRCLICQQVVTDLRKELKKVDPNKKLDIGNYRIDEAPNQVPYALSSLHISDSLEQVCKGIDDYVRATDKKTGELLLLKLILESGGMNPKMSEVDIIQDGDLNKSLQYYCLGIVEDGEELLTQLIQDKESDITDKLCRQNLRLCSEKLSDYDLKEDDVKEEL